MRQTESTLYRRLRQKAVKGGKAPIPQISRLSVRQLPRLPGRPPLGLARIGIHTLPCAIGAKGIGVKSREGDSLTPIGRHRIEAWTRRPDRWRIFRPDCRAIFPSQGWCDDSKSWSYNRPIALPARYGAERLWRDDGLYDLIGLIDYNFRPRILGKGSAIFLHVAQEDYRPTAGCVAFPAEWLRKIQFLLAPKTQVAFGDIFVRRSPKIAEPTRI